MIQTFALLMDSYRELNAKRLFWVVLGLTGLVVLLFASFGLNGQSLTFLGWATPVRAPFLSLVTPEVFYKQAFVTFGIGFWLSWLASILALVSTAGIFPDLMAGGSIDLYLSKPISRPRLFLTKVVGGLLFVTLQVTVFCACCFAVLRARAGVWVPGLFVAVPLVTLMFSYLFSVCVLMGVLTRSTVASLLLTLLFWVVIFAAQKAETFLLLGQTYDHDRAARLDRQIPAMEARLAAMPPARPTTTGATEPATDTGGGGYSLFHPFGGGRTSSRVQVELTLANLRAERQRMTPDRFDTGHAVAAALVAPLPKTAGTIELLERQLVKLGDLPPPPKATDEDADMIAPPDPPPPGRGGRRGRDPDGAVAGRDVDVQLRQRPASYILGTSIAFEVVVLGLAGWLFCRRDY
jgi:ABC-type transport system involved in multi-copper enzyme maturation permease subunit